MSMQDETPHLTVTAGLAGAFASAVPSQDAEPDTADAEQES